MKLNINTYTYLLVSILIIISSCNTTKHLEENEYLLRKNSIEFESSKNLSGKNTLEDNLDGIIVQQPNSYFLFPFLTYKLWLYNLRYDKYQTDTTNFQIESGTVEKPVIYDSTTIPESKEYMKSYMFHQGYFYAQVEDTTVLKRKKAYVTYSITPGINYLIRQVNFKGIQDSAISKLVRKSFKETELRAGRPYTADLMESERTRITTMLRDNGYCNFSNSNISFVLDTTTNDYLKKKDNGLEEAIEFITNREQDKPTLDVYLNIENDEDSNSFKLCAINNISVYPDFRSQSDLKNKNLLSKDYHGVEFNYHDYYVRNKVLFNHIFLSENEYLAQSDYDRTITGLNQLGIFESVRIDYVVDSSKSNSSTRWLNAIITMSPTDRFTFNTNFEVSNGTTYDLGSAVTLGLRNNNVLKGANILSSSVTGGIETQYVNSQREFQIVTRTFGTNLSLEFPKFLFPISRDRYSIRNSPRTEIAAGASLLDRSQFFTLLNLTSKFTYKWRETKTKSWEVTPIFVNDISLLDTSESFKARLDSIEYLRNSYRSTFIEGESIAWTYNNGQDAKWYENYQYVRLGFEEAGGIMSGLNTVADGLVGNFSRYVKFDFDLRHFIQQRHATTAFRFHGGVGLPYGGDKTLPYIKQYFVGGAFSIRGWGIRTLGPGSYFDSSTIDVDPSSIFLDRTGDIKLELNGEYRFDLFSLFSNVMTFEGAAFGDAGNIWLSQPSDDFPDGEFRFDKIYNDLAVSTGLGIRANIAEIFLLRFDVAFPVKYPANRYLKAAGNNDGWVIDKIALGRSDWRQENLVLNIAIGYPF